MKRITICVSGEYEKHMADAIAQATMRLLQEAGFSNSSIRMEEVPDENKEISIPVFMSRIGRKGVDL